MNTSTITYFSSSVFVDEHHKINKYEKQMKIKISIITDWLFIWQTVYQEKDVTRELGKALSMKFRLTTQSLHLDHFHCSG